MYKTHKINNIKVRPIPEDKNKIVRSSIFPKPHNVILIASTMGSGKTTALATIIRDIIIHYPLQKILIDVDKNNTPIKSCFTLGEDDKPDINKPKYERKLTFLIFSTTAFVDPKWKYIIEMIARSKSKFGVHISTYDDDGINILERLITEIREIKEKEDSDDDDQTTSYSDDEIKDRIIKLLKPINGNGDYVVVFDDLTDEYRANRSTSRIIKLLRHLDISNIIMISQDPIDFTPGMLSNCTSMMIFNGLGIDRLEHIHKKLALKIPIKDFINVYDQATNDKFHNFLYIDRSNRNYYKNFDELFEI